MRAPYREEGREGHGAITLDGEERVARGMRPGDVAPGPLACEAQGRRVWRVLCADGGDLVVRNTRYPFILAATFPDECMAVEH